MRQIAKRSADLLERSRSTTLIVLTSLPGWDREKTKRNGSTWTRWRARIPKLAMLENPNTKTPMYAIAIATYGCRRTLLTAARIQRHRHAHQSEQHRALDSGERRLDIVRLR